MPAWNTSGRRSSACERQVPAVGPAADRHPVQVEERIALGRGVEAFHLIRQPDVDVVAVHRLIPGRRPGTGCRGRRSRAPRTPGPRTIATPGASAASAARDRNAVRRTGRAAREACCRFLRAASGPRGEQGVPQLVRPQLSRRPVGLAGWAFRRVARRCGPVRPSRTKVAVGNASSSYSLTSTMMSPPTTAPCTPTLVRQPLQRAVGSQPPHMHLGGFLGRSNHDRLTRFQHGIDLQAYRRHPIVVDQQAARVIA